jgi:5-oxoprolinase (ATP-hydrolysing)
MTNTAMTDTEVLELRLPVRVERFAIRRGSGGGGTFRGGNGIERRLQFLEAVSLSVLAQRRTSGPPGGGGGESGKPGEQWIERADGSRETVAGISGVELNAGDRLVLLTPGGGGWGSPEHN